MEHDPRQQQVQRQHRQGHRADDREVAEQRQNDPDREGDREDDVDVGEDEVDEDGVDVGSSLGQQRAAVLAQALDHPPCPAPPLAGEALHVFRGAGEGDRGALVPDPAARAHHRPGEDDVLADPVRPAANRLQRRGPVDAERPLGDHRPLEEALLALDRGDAEEVVPLLRAGDEVVTGVADEHRTGDGDRVRRGDQQSRDDAPQCRAASPGCRRRPSPSAACAPRPAPWSASAPCRRGGS